MTNTKMPRPYALKSPCGNCPFRCDKPFYLRPERAAEIAEGLSSNGADFHCHKTVQYDDEGQSTIDPDKTKVCAGALIVMEKSGVSTQAMRIAERLGLYDATALDMDAPVYDSLAEWVNAKRAECGEEIDDPEVEMEHCGVVGAGCNDPAGFMSFGDVMDNAAPPQCRSDHSCQHCGAVMCEACTATEETVQTRPGNSFAVFTCVVCEQGE